MQVGKSCGLFSIPRHPYYLEPGVGAKECGQGETDDLAVICDQDSDCACDRMTPENIKGEG
jgi:hypothetical protein